MKYPTAVRNTLVLKCLAALVTLCFAASCAGDDYVLYSTIQGTISDYETGALLENASVTLTPSGLTRQTDASGQYRFEELDIQQYTITVQKSGYQPNRKTVTAISGETLQVDIQLSSIPKE